MAAHAASLRGVRRHDPIAHGEALHLLAHGLDRAAELMSDGYRIIAPPSPFEDVDIGAADARRGDAELHLHRVRLGLGPVGFELQVLFPRTRLHKRPHPAASNASFAVFAIVAASNP